MKPLLLIEFKLSVPLASPWVPFPTATVPAAVRERPASEDAPNVSAPLSLSEASTVFVLAVRFRKSNCQPEPSPTISAPPCGVEFWLNRYVAAPPPVGNPVDPELARTPVAEILVAVAAPIFGV